MFLEYLKGSISIRISDKESGITLLFFEDGPIFLSNQNIPVTAEELFCILSTKQSSELQILSQHQISFWDAENKTWSFVKFRKVDSKNLQNEEGELGRSYEIAWEE